MQVTGAEDWIEQWIFFTWSLEEVQLKFKEPAMEEGVILTRDFFPFKNALEQIAFGKVMPQ